MYVSILGCWQGRRLIESSFLADHEDYETLVEQAMAPIGQGGPNSPLSNNNLINGKMNYDCSQTSMPCKPNAGVSKFNFQSGKSHRLRLINSGAQAIQKFSIDGHNLTVIANDFVPLQPYDTDHVSLGIGQRADIIVNGTGEAGEAYWMRSNIKGCSNNDGISPLALAAIYYEDADTSQKPSTSSSVDDSAITYCANDPLQSTTPYYPISVSLLNVRLFTFCTLAPVCCFVLGRFTTVCSHNIWDFLLTPYR